MKIYTMCCGWAGSIDVVANSEEEAHELMKPCENYNEKNPVDVHEIKEGFLFYDLGDL